MQSTPNNDNWRLGGFFALYFAVLGATVPYFSLYLDSLGFTPQQIGLLMSILLITKIIAPNFLGFLIDRQTVKGRLTHNRTLVVALFISFCLFSLLNITQQFWLIGLLMASYSFFWNAVLPQFEALVYNHLGSDCVRYGRIRLWGSIGFIVLVLAMGWLLEHHGIQALIPCISLLFLLLAASSLLLRQAPNSSKPVNQHRSGLRTLLTPTVLALLFLSALSQLSHAPFYTFFSIYLESYDYNKVTIGSLWALGVIAEVFIFLFAHHLLARFSLIKLLSLCFALTALRWFLFAQFPETLWMMALGQALHAVSFGLYHSTMSQIINRHFVASNQVKGQALYSSVTFGIGGAAGTLLSGYLWTILGGEKVFLWAAYLMLFVTIATYFLSYRANIRTSSKA